MKKYLVLGILVLLIVSSLGCITTMVEKVAVVHIDKINYVDSIYLESYIRCVEIFDKEKNEAWCFCAYPDEKEEYTSLLSLEEDKTYIITYEIQMGNKGQFGPNWILSATEINATEE